MVDEVKVVEPEVKTIVDPAAAKELVENGRTATDALKPDQVEKKIDKEGLNEEQGKKEVETKTDDEKAKEEEAKQKNEDGSWKEKYIEIDNVHATAAIDLLKEANVSPLEANDIFAEAIKHNDLSKVDWTRLEKRLGASKAALVKAGVETYYNDEYKKNAEVVDKAYDMFGGEENWDKVRKHFQKAEKTDTALKGKINELRKSIEIGGWAAEQALKELKTMYEAAPGTVGLGVSKRVEGGKPAANTGQDITKADFQAELAKADRERWPEAKINELRARRKATIAKEFGS